MIDSPGSSSYPQPARRQPRLARALARARQRQLHLASVGRHAQSARYAQLAHRLRVEYDHSLCLESCASALQHAEADAA